NLGEAYEAQEQPELAIEHYQAALDILTPSSFPLDCIETAEKLGHLARQQQDWETAIQGYDTAIRAAEQSRNWATYPESKRRILEQALPLYGQLIEACLQLNRPQQALLAVERSKSRTLIELLNQADLVPKNASPQQQHQYRQLNRDIAALQWSIAADDPNPSDASPPQGQRHHPNAPPNPPPSPDLQSLLQQREQLLKTINDPDFIPFQNITPDLPDLRQLLTPHSAILEWYLPQDSQLGAYAFLITLNQDQVHIQPHRYSPQERQQLDEFHNSYFSNYRDRQWYKSLDDRLNHLAQHLQLDRLLADLDERQQRLILIPHLYLHLFPLHALRTASGELLVDRFSQGVSFAPSCQILSHLQTRRSSPGSDFFAVENPTQDLDYTEMELDFIRPQFDPNSYVLQGPAANKAALNSPETLQKLSQSHFLHFACHGSFDDANPLNSALILAGDTRRNGEGRQFLTLRDGRRFDTQERGLTLREILANLDLRVCRLVMLSACETGLLRSELTDEYLGLAMGFLYAGSPSVVSSLWCVDDFATACLAIRFYWQFCQDWQVVEGLQKAQTWLRHVSQRGMLEWFKEEFQVSEDDLAQLELILGDYDESHPFGDRRYWSAFVAIGI
ncbi:MAG: CHAT domain-containing protein, partial [Phormidium sp. GEM2.Bin31]